MNDGYMQARAMTAGVGYPNDSISFTVTKIENGLLLCEQGMKDGEYFQRYYHVSDAYYVGSRIQDLLEVHEAKPVPPAPWPAPTIDDDAIPF